MAEPVLKVTALNKSFGGVRATDNVSLEIEENELHAIIGPNGAGKTTLISQLSGSSYPDGGSIRFRGREIARQPAYVRSHLGLGRSFQITSLLMDMTVLENVMLAAQAHDGHSFRFWKPVRSDQGLRKTAMAAIDRVGLQGRVHDLASAMSHGERRQLEIAVALATGPELLLLDEPMAGMGVEESAAMVETLKGFKGKITMLLVEHDMDAVFALADRISVLVYGRIIATGTPADIRGNAEVRRAYLGDE